MVCIFDPACELFPPMDGEELDLCTVECCPSTVPSLWPPPPYPPSQCTVYTDNVWLWGGGDEMYCGQYYAGVLHSVSDQIRNLQNWFTAPNKMTSEDDIKGLVSLTSFVHESTSPSTRFLSSRQPLFLYESPSCPTSTSSVSLSQSFLPLWVFFLKTSRPSFNPNLPGHGKIWPFLVWGLISLKYIWS
jgi:hypothetical protein